jgi:hypothetical protein
VRLPRANRRNFLRGAAGVSIALPFLEGLPERSAWAIDEEPVFSLFICAACGVLGPKFFPDQPGALSESSLAEAGKATSELARHAKNLLFLSGVDLWPDNEHLGDSHATGSCEVLTARKPTGSGSSATASGPSADVVIASRVQPGTEPLTLYAGNLRNGYIAERLSFTEDGKVRPASDNPYVLYSQLVGLASPGGGMAPDGERAARLLLESRKSVHDLVRGELATLLSHPRLSSTDHQRLQQHFNAIRELEVTMDGMGDDALEACSSMGLDTDKLEALMGGYHYSPNGSVEELGRLHMSLVALAFACNFNRTATIQWGDGTDHSIYDVPSNARGWNLHFISHRTQSDGAVGDDPLAEQAHGEIDHVRMASFAAGLDHFAARGLQDRSVVMWTNHIADGPSHSFQDVPVVIWGSGGHLLKQAEYVALDHVTNNRLLTTLVNASIRDTGTSIAGFGDAPNFDPVPGILS